MGGGGRERGREGEREGGGRERELFENRKRLFWVSVHTRLHLGCA